MAAFGMVVRVWGRGVACAQALSQTGCRWRDAGGVLSQCDVVSLHIRSTDETRGLHADDLSYEVDGAARTLRARSS